MKHKTLLGISAALTTLVLLLTAGVVIAVQKVNAAGEAPTVQQASSQSLGNGQGGRQEPIERAAGQSKQAPGDLAGPVLMPQRAAAIAAQYLGRNDLYAVESSTMDSRPAYLVTFSSGDQVYISLDGQVLVYTPAQQLTAQNSAPLASVGEHEEHEREEHEQGEYEHGEYPGYDD